MRVMIHENPYQGMEDRTGKAPWEITTYWPCWWVGCGDAGEAPFVTAYRCLFTLEKPETLRIHVSADERYELFLDGVRMGRGSERGDTANWFFETYDLAMDEGQHVLAARVWSLGVLRSCGQVSLYPGFILSPQTEDHIRLIGTGIADWEAKKLDGYTFIDSYAKGVGTGARFSIDGGRFPWGFERGEGEGWKAAVKLDKGYSKSNIHIAGGVHVMRPALLPPMLEQEIQTGSTRYFEPLASTDTRDIPVNSSNHLASEEMKWNGLLKGIPLTVGPDTVCWVILDLEGYYCAYPELTVTGGKGSEVRLAWAEALYDRNTAGTLKSNRDEIDGKYFAGIGDVFFPDGSRQRKFDTLWWHAGRYVEIVVRTGSEALTLEKLTLTETRYPLELESAVRCDDEKLNSIISVLFRSLQMCTHETYMDCPYWEQLMYVGDTRLQALITYVSTLDDTMPEKAVEMLEASRFNPTRLIKCSYPEHGGKIIPSFCLWWIGMVYDYALWRSDKQFVRSMMRGVRDTLDAVIVLNDDGLVINTEGWNFIDWPADDRERWKYGIPPDDERRVSGIFNWLTVLALNMAAELEQYVGEPELAARARRMADTLAGNTVRLFWNEEKGLFADDLKLECYSEHTQCLAVLSGCLDEEKKNRIGRTLASQHELIRTTIYFSHYAFEALRELNKVDALFDYMKPWLALEEEGLKTTPEVFSPGTRSDCHAWGAHPLYHYFATILGIRPGRMGFETVVIRPNLGPLKHVQGTMVHPKGKIHAGIHRDEQDIHAIVELPAGLTGVFSYGGQDIPLSAGRQEVVIR